MQTAAILWHVSLLAPDDRRALALGLVGLVRVVPVIGFSLLSGVAADALDRRRLMLVTQSTMALLAVVLATMTFRGLSSLWPIYVLAACSSAAGAFDLPARQSLVPNLVPREHLPNAITLNTIMVQIASVAGPALGGVVIATGGVAWVYALNAASFLVRHRRAADDADAAGRRGAAGATAAGIRGNFTVAAALEGLRFVFRAPLIRSTMLLDFFATFFSSATALLPIFAQDVLHVGAQGYGWLYAAPAVGAVVTSALMIRGVDWIERRGVVLLVGHRGLWRGDRRLRGVAGVLADVRVPGRHRRGRHGEHGVPEPDSPARDAGPAARPHGRRQHGVLHGRPAARGARSRPRGQRAWGRPSRS